MPVDEIPAGATVTYSQQFRRCGNPECATCKAGGHGPYWYAYWREGGRRRSRYLGKQPPPGLAAPDAGAGGEPPLGAGATRDAPSPCVDDATVMPPVGDVLAPAPLRVRTLGAFQVWRDEAPIPPARRQQRKVMVKRACPVPASPHIPMIKAWAAQAGPVAEPTGDAAAPARYRSGS